VKIPKNGHFLTIFTIKTSIKDQSILRLPAMQYLCSQLVKMDIISQIRNATGKTLLDSYQYSIAPDDIQVNETKPEFTGDYTVVLFSFVKSLKRSPEVLGNELGEALLKAHPDLFAAFNVIKGFLNLTVSDAYWTNFLSNNHANDRFGVQESNGKKVMVEYSSPNTNKPLHLGHL
jgi:arginyl-tRNA synthetase